MQTFSQISPVLDPKNVFEVIGFSSKEAKDQFGFLLDALSMGAPPHGGIAFGIDRIVMLLANEDFLSTPP